MSDEYDSIPFGPYSVKAKCCGKCACRRGSPERRDPYGWIFMTEVWPDGVLFFCHEGIPWHHQFNQLAPRFSLCGGWAALKDNPKALFRHIGDDALDSPAKEGSPE